MLDQWLQRQMSGVGGGGWEEASEVHSLKAGHMHLSFPCARQLSTELTNARMLKCIGLLRNLDIFSSIIVVGLEKML